MSAVTTPPRRRPRRETEAPDDGGADRARPGGPQGGAAAPPRRARAAVPDRPDPVALLERQARVARARARPDPLRAHARLAVHLLPRRGRDHGGRPRRRTPALGLHVAALRRRPPVQLRRLRLARAAARLRHQRLRRDPARAVGVGREAAGGQLRGGRPRQRLQRRRPARGRPPRRVRSTATAMREFAAMRNLEVWYARLDVDERRSELRAAATREAASGAPSRRSPRRAPSDSMQAFAKLTHDGRRRAADHQPTRR